MSYSDDKGNMGPDWEHRVLCSDESCIGTIGPDGCCKECGRPYEGELPAGFLSGQANVPAVSGSSGEEDFSDGSPVNAEGRTESDQTPNADDEWAQRTLCSDESCIGVVGADGRCKECGLPHPEK